MIRRVLIIDDEFGIADVVAEILTETGYEASIAINGQQGLIAMREVRPHLVLLDVMMPILDGPSMLREVRQDPDINIKSTPVVLMTALREAVPNDTPPLHQAVLYKPFTEKALFDVIELLLPPLHG